MSKKLRMGVIGTGAFSLYHLDGIQKAKNAELIAICDKDSERLAAKAEQFGVETTYTDYHELLAREDIDAVTLPLPDQVHAEIAIAAMRAGKHVLCEKPMALDLNECKEMIKVARETGKELMVGQIGRYTPAFVKAKELLDAGVIGELFMVESEYAHDYTGKFGTDGWRKQPEREAIIGGGCHAVDLIRMMAGNPEEVFAYANNFCQKDWPIHDCSLAIMKFPTGVIGKVMNSHGCKRAYTMRSALYGTKGTIIFDNTSPYISLFLERFTENETVKDMHQQSAEIRIPITLANHNATAEVQDFVDCILAGKPVPTDGVEGASTASVCLAIVESFKTGNKVTVDYNF
ncbi:MAG: Gfo/Idh/MocA family oxidoreductase [Clostridia bacterium]|nr:Gfo/Idh/MocA family oxidoreductase [Clostridia bacterium]